MEVLELKKQTPIAIMDEVKFLEKRELRSILSTFPEVNILLKPEVLKAKVNRLKTDKMARTDLAGTFILLAKALKDSKTREELIHKISELKKSAHKRYDENIAAIAEQTKELRSNIFSLKVAFDNHQQGKIRVMPVDRQQFVESPDDSYWKRLQMLIMKEFKLWDMLNCPCYLSLTFPLETPGAAQKIAQFMESVLGIAQLDIPVFNNSDSVITFIDESFKLVGGGELGHILFSGTHGEINGVYENMIDGKRLPLAMGPAFAVKMMSVNPGEYFVSLSGSPIKGIDGVTCQYHFERDDAAEFSKRGLIQILDSGAVMGVDTCCTGDIEEYNSFTTMDLFIMCQRALINMANQIVPGPFGEEERESFIQKLVAYFSKLYDNADGTRVIDAPVTEDQISVRYDKENRCVYVSIPIKYKGVVSRYVFTLSGDKDGFSEIGKTKA